MDKFSEWVNAGIAPTHYKTNIAGEIPNQDPFVRGYNNVWGIVSDTHMSKLDDGRYVITGSMVARQREFTNFLYACHWGGYTFSNTSLSKVTDTLSLSGYLDCNHLIGHFDILNGDNVYMLVPGENTNYTVGLAGCCCTTCSNLPIRTESIFRNGSEKMIDGDPFEVAKTLSESADVTGNHWMVSGDINGYGLVNEHGHRIPVRLMESDVEDEVYIDDLRGGKLKQFCRNVETVLQGDLDVEDIMQAVVALQGNSYRIAPVAFRMEDVDHKQTLTIDAYDTTLHYNWSKKAWDK